MAGTERLRHSAAPDWIFWKKGTPRWMKMDAGKEDTKMDEDGCSLNFLGRSLFSTLLTFVALLNPPHFYFFIRPLDHGETLPKELVSEFSSE
jgi:hypothetical protein